MASGIAVAFPNAALRQLAAALGEVGQRPTLALSVRARDELLNVREFAAYLSLLDGLYGRLDPLGYRSYSHALSRQLRIDRVGRGSLDLILLFNLVSEVETWRVLLLFLVVRAGPGILRGEAAKNWAEAIKTGIEAYQLLASGPDRGPSTKPAERLSPRAETVNPLRCTRRQRAELKQLMREDPQFSQLSERHKGQIISLIEAVLNQERHKLPAAVRFADEYVVEVWLRRIN